MAEKRKAKCGDVNFGVISSTSMAVGAPVLKEITHEETQPWRALQPQVMFHRYKCLGLIPRESDPVGQGGDLSILLFLLLLFCSMSNYHGQPELRTSVV